MPRGVRSNALFGLWRRSEENMEMLKTFVLQVEPFAGSDIKDVSVELCQLAGRVGVRCEARFNGEKLWARPGDNPLRLVEAFHAELQKPCGHKIAQAA